MDGNSSTSQVLFAYVVPSYQWAISSIESIERRIEGWITSILGVGLAFLLVAEAFGGGITGGMSVSLLAVGAAMMALMITGILLGWHARRLGQLSVVELSELLEYEGSAEEARREAIDQAATDLNLNSQLVKDKSNLAAWMMLVFVLEIMVGGVFLGLTVA